MRKIFKKSISILLAMLCAFNLAVVSFAEETVTSGTCGENSKWSFDEASGKLTISGYGEMNDYAINNNSIPYYYPVPWADYKPYVKLIEISSDITYIGMNTFRDCIEVTELILPEGVSRIGTSAFGGCKKLYSVKIPESITVIDSGAFLNSQEIKEVYYAGSFEKWNAISFASKESNPLRYEGKLYFNGDLVEDLIIPDGIKEINKNVFGNNSCITSVTIPDSVESIGENAFISSDKLEVTYYIGTEEQWNEIAIASGNDALTRNVVFNYGKPTNVCGENATWVFDETSGTLTISGTGAISDYSGWENLKDKITYIEIDDGITVVAANAFADCSLVDGVTLPASLEIVYQDAFLHCDSLKDVYYLGSIEDWCEINFAHYYGNPNVYADNFYINGELVAGDFVIPEGPEYIGVYTFTGCEDIISLTIPNSVIQTESHAFYACKGLTSVTLPNTLKTLGEFTFSGCSALENVVVPESVTKIENDVFGNCTSLKSVVLPSGITEISTQLFRECSSLEEITIPYGVTRIKGLAFYRCYSLTEVEIPPTVTTIDSSFQECSNLEEVVISHSVTTIGDRAFTDCTNLATTYYTGTEEQWNEIAIASGNDALKRKVVFNYGKPTNMCGENATWVFDETSGTLTISGTGAVSDYSGWNEIASAVTYIEIGNGITTVGECAFNGFTALKEVYLAESVTELGADAFKDCSRLAIVTALSDDLSFSNAFLGNDSRLFFVAKAGSGAYTALKSAGFTVNGISTDKEKDGHKVLSFDGKTTIYKNLDYNYISNLITENSDAHYLYFDKITFDGIAPDIIIVDEENLDKAEEYFTLNEVYISVSVNGKTVSLPELVELLLSGDVDGIISFEQKDEPTIFEQISDFFENAFDNFITEANRVIISVINALKRLFRR